MSDPQGFRDALLAWVREDLDPQAEKIVHFTADGSDWAGDTEGGFYPEFGVSLSWRTEGGGERRKSLEGSDMSSLWNFVVGAWPSPGQVPGEERR